MFTRAVPAALAAAFLALPVPARPEPALPLRVRRIVLHVLGSPTYDRPDRRHEFLPPAETHAHWARRFGAHWIVWTDGTLWPRHAAPGTPRFLAPPASPLEEAAWRRRVLADAVPVYSHVHLGNTRALGIEVAHSGRRGDPFPPEQADTVARLLRTLLDASAGRLTPASVVGHKDLDRRPAFVSPKCTRAGCLVFVDEAGRPYRRRVDPPEGLFRSLADRGFVVPRPEHADDDLARTETLAPGAVPATARGDGS